MSILEKMAISDAEFDKRPWDSMSRADKNRYRERTRVALAATGLTEAQLEGLANGTMTVAPAECTIKMMKAFWLAGPYPEKPFDQGYRAMLAAKEG